ncbi:MAG TPA: hypothetical protein VFV50_14105 [Bdellovibrionales bacterium]|nr:hypothetical protein [Bdellovibrionales bacterium]
MVLLDDPESAAAPAGAQSPDSSPAQYIDLEMTASKAGTTDPGKKRLQPPMPPPPPVAMPAEPVPPADFYELDVSAEDIEVVSPGAPPPAAPEPPAGFVPGGFDAEAFANPPAPVPELEFPQSPNPAGNSIDEIAQYGNSELSQANDGLLMFDVIVEGIDTNELRAAVREILDDKRFLWNADSLVSTIRNGHLRVPKINSIKASLLVKRLKHLDVRIRWEQYAIVQMAGN